MHDGTVVYYRTVGCMTGLLCITEGLWCMTGLLCITEGLWDV